MRSTLTQYQTRRHPVAAGLILLLIGPYLLAFAALFVLAFIIAAILDMAVGRKS